MNTRLLAAIGIAAAVAIAAFFKFSSSSNAQAPFSVTGKWKLDSFYAIGSDSGGLSMLTLAMLNNGAAQKLTYRFNTDSTVYVDADDKEKGGDTARYYLADSVLYFKTGKGFEPFRLLHRSDSSFSYLASDSVVMVLKKLQ